MGNKDTFQVINSKWMKTQQNRCFKMLLMTKKQQKELGDNDQERQLSKSSLNKFQKREKQMATSYSFDTK